MNSAQSQSHVIRINHALTCSLNIDSTTNASIYYDIYYIKSVIVAFMDITKLFKNGRSQALRLPKEYRFDGTDVCIKNLKILQKP